MEVFTRQDAPCCGIDEEKNLLGHVLVDADPPSSFLLEALDDGDQISSKEVVASGYRVPLAGFRLYENGLPRDARPGRRA